MKLSQKTRYIYTAFWLFVLFLFWRAILCINFSKNPYYYCTDMYSDILYAAEVWSNGTIFPEGWVFGNQLYCVATPVLAALFYGIVKDPCITMGIAATLMGIGVVVSFSWMLKPVFTKLHERLAAICVFMTVVLLCGDPIYLVNGWQLFFTMCSYYACYAITAFLAIGCYIRSSSKWTASLYFPLIICCALSFGTGIQSMRQTAVMTIPLIAVECLKRLYSIVKKAEYSSKPMWVAGIIGISNISGVLVSSLIPVEKNEIFGALNIGFPADFLNSLISSSSVPFTLFSSFSQVAIILFFVVCICSVIYFFQNQNWSDNAFFTCLLLHIVSIVVIFGISLFTKMYIREIYYFMLYPLAAIVITFVYSRFRNVSKLLIVILIIVTLPYCNRKLDYYVCPPANNHPIQQISDYLEKQEIGTVYSHWNFGEKIAIASDYRIRVGFWDYRLDVFESVKYICNPSVFDVDPSKCAYVVQGKETYDKAIEVAWSRGVKLNLMQHFPEQDIYIFCANQKLMK